MHVFLSLKTKNYPRLLKHLPLNITNVRLVEHDLNTKQTTVEADVPPTTVYNKHTTIESLVGFDTPIFR